MTLPHKTASAIMYSNCWFSALCEQTGPGYLKDLNVMRGNDRRDNEENSRRLNAREGVNVIQLKIITMVYFNDPHKGSLV